MQSLNIGFLNDYHCLYRCFSMIYSGLDYPIKPRRGGASGMDIKSCAEMIKFIISTSYVSSLHKYFIERFSMAWGRGHNSQCLINIKNTGKIWNAFRTTMTRATCFLLGLSQTILMDCIVFDRRSRGATVCASTWAAITAAWSRSSVRFAIARSRATFCNTCARTPTRSRSVARRAATVSPSAPSSKSTCARTRSVSSSPVSVHRFHPFLPSFPFRCFSFLCFFLVSSQHVSISGFLCVLNAFPQLRSAVVSTWFYWYFGLDNWKLSSFIALKDKADRTISN